MCGSGDVRRLRVYSPAQRHLPREPRVRRSRGHDVPGLDEYAGQSLCHRPRHHPRGEGRAGPLPTGQPLRRVPGAGGPGHRQLRRPPFGRQPGHRRGDRRRGARRRFRGPSSGRPPRHRRLRTVGPGGPALPPVYCHAPVHVPASSTNRDSRLPHLPAGQRLERARRRPARRPQLRRLRRHHRRRRRHAR